MKTRNEQTNLSLPVEPKAVASRQPTYAWEMTLEQFRERFFPELCTSSNDDQQQQQQQQRIAA